MSTSKLQEKTAQLLNYHFPYLKIYENHRPKWLRGVDLEVLELDFYIPERKLAVEVQGKQHYEFVPYFHNTYEDFKKQIERDQIKKDLCYGKKITLVEIANEFELDLFIKDFINKENSQNKIEDYFLLNERTLSNFNVLERKAINRIIKFEKHNSKHYLEQATSKVAKLLSFSLKHNIEIKNNNILVFYSENKNEIDFKFNVSLKSRIYRHQKKLKTVNSIEE